MIGLLRQREMNEKNDHLVDICLENGAFLSSTWLKELYSFLHMKKMNKKDDLFHC